MVSFALQGNSRVLVDAEHTYFQPAIDALTLRLQQRCNRHDPVIINTYQVPLTSPKTLHYKPSQYGRAP